CCCWLWCSSPCPCAYSALCSRCCCCRCSRCKHSARPPTCSCCWHIASIWSCRWSPPSTWPRAERRAVPRKESRAGRAAAAAANANAPHRHPRTPVDVPRRGNTSTIASKHPQARALLPRPCPSSPSRYRLSVLDRAGLRRRTRFRTRGAARGSIAAAVVGTGEEGAERVDRVAGG
ncbi:hypothetical protein C8R44DRAFT_991452, partial [Mycena epipterygia]